MVDTWMLFNLVLPFIEVLLHTYIDLLREGEEEAEPRQINHHGKIIDVDEQDEELKNVSVIKVAPKDDEKHDKNLISVNEKVQQRAMKSYYEK